jgi:hypothetical protein
MNIHPFEICRILRCHLVSIGRIIPHIVWIVDMLAFVEYFLLGFHIILLVILLLVNLVCSILHT